MKLQISKTNIITTVEQWQQFAPPKDKIKHWKDGRSAKSLAQFMTDLHQKAEETQSDLPDLADKYRTEAEILLELYNRLPDFYITK